MSTMSEIATTLELEWRETVDGYRYCTGQWHILRNSWDGRHSLYRAGNATPVVTGELHTAVHYVMSLPSGRDRITRDSQRLMFMDSAEQIAQDIADVRAMYADDYADHSDPDSMPAADDIAEMLAWAGVR